MADARLTRITVLALPSLDKPPPPPPQQQPQLQQPPQQQPQPVDLFDRTENDQAFLNSGGATTTSMAVEVGVKRKRGRPPRNHGVSSPATVAVNKRSKKEKVDEDVCFICFDGGDLVLCDRRECPKAYHPACIKRDESFFRPSIRWNCGWHLCNFCQRMALFMCYTCPYSLCKQCVNQADILRIRGNKGFCRTCMKTIMLIENIPHETKEQVQVDFDDITSWEYLFKVYWIYVKEKEALTLDELTRATNPWRVCGLENDSSLPNRVGTFISDASNLSSNNVQLEINAVKRRKTRKQQQSPSLESQNINKPDENNVSNLLAVADWASKELLEFVAHMKNGDISILSQFDVQALLLDYIRKNNLRDPRRKCQIICDKRLQNMFGKERVGHFEMLKLLEYHFKEESRTNGVVRSAAVDPLAGSLENEGNYGDIHNSSRETRRQTRRKAEEKDRQTKLDSFAAIDVHNINLIYLKRSLLENLMVDSTNIHDKVVGSVVRIRISSNDKKQDMHRLVRIIGTSKAPEKYKVGDRAESFMLQIVNLNKIEDIPVTAISDQEFSEDECRRLRQSIKLGLAERMTVGEIQEKAMALQTGRVDDSLETEMRKLTHLRDRASEMGHRKELRECVEKIELLKSPEERLRRIYEILDVHADPKMDPSYGSDDDSGSDIKNQDGPVMPKHKNSIAKGAELSSPVRAGNMLKDNRTKVLKTSVASGERKRKNSASFHVGKVEVSKRPLEPCKSERFGASHTLELNNRVSVEIVAGESGITATGSISHVTSASTDPTALSSRMLFVSDITELEKIWHYQDPSGKIQGPFCMLQLRKWESNGFFPSNLRVWKTSESPDQSTLLTDVLKKQQSSEPESHVEQQSDCGGESDDKIVSSLEEFSSNSNTPSMNHKANERSCNKSLDDITATSEVNAIPTIGFSGLLQSDDQDGISQSELEMKARLIESLFDTEEPSSIATPTGSSETMQVTHNIESSHPSTSTSKSDNVDFESQGVKSQSFSPNAGGKDLDPPSSTPNSNPEDLKGHNLENHIVTSCIAEDLDAGIRSNGTLHPPSNMPTMEDRVDHDAEKNESTVSSGIDVSVMASVMIVENDLKPNTVENRHSIPSDAPRQDSEAIWNSTSDGPNVSVFPSNKFNMELTEAHAIESKHYNSTNNAPKQDSGTNWSTISGGIVFSDLPSNLTLENNSLETLAIVNKVNVGPNVSGHSQSSWSSISEGLRFSDLITSPKLDEASRGQVMENKNSALSNVPGQESCISWSTASNLVGGEVHLPDVSSDWGAYSAVNVKPVEDFNASLFSGSSANMVDITGDHATPTSHSYPMTTLHCDTSSWQPIELSVLGDESVSDLLTEVEAMESLRGMCSPTSRMNCGDDSIDSPGDCFSPLGGLSPNIDPGRNDALSSTADLHFHINPNMPSQSHVSTIRDLPRTSCILSIGSPELEEVKPAIASIPLQNFVSEVSVSVMLPPPSSLRPSPPPQQALVPLPQPSLLQSPPSAASVPPPVSFSEPSPSVSVSQPSPPLPPPEKLASPPPPPSSTLSLERPSSPCKEGEVDPTLLVHHQQNVGLHQSSSQPAHINVAAVDSSKQGSENTSTNRDPGTSSILGTPNLHWSTSGPGMAAASVNSHWSTSVASQGTRGPSQTSPRYSSHNNVGRHSGSKDRSHHHHGVDSGYSKSRPTSWNRQSSIGGGGGSARQPSRGQRVCKFYESGYCKKGASCKYLHP